ncbi:MAG: metallopeptidase TldD-related protein [Thiolinea sp.]
MHESDRTPGWRAISTAKASAFSGRIGEQVASKGITVVDDGTLEQRRAVP